MADEERASAPNDVEMSVWDHLEELRWVVVRAVIGVVVGMVICGIFEEYILDYVLFSPLQRTTPPVQLHNMELFGQLSIWMQIVIWGGLIVSFPYTLVQIWKFVAPGLHEHEKKYVWQITFFTIFSFFAGMAFAYWVMLPMVLNYAVSFGSSQIQNLITVQNYLAIFIEIVIISGLVFELPLISFFLSKMGILTPAFMRHYRKHTIVVLLFVAAVLSPGGNPMLQLILFFPLWALYELSIGSSVIVARQKRRAELKDQG
jgi:sec-independent protein translocase protein TatC